MNIIDSFLKHIRHVKKNISEDVKRMNYVLINCGVRALNSFSSETAGIDIE